MNHISDPLEMPKVLRDQEKDINMDAVSINQWEEGPVEVKHSKWSDKLWPTMAWSIFGFNMFVALTFCMRLLVSTENVAGSVHTIMEYVVIVITMCGTYIVLMWAHYNILRKK